jgi:hypothetical protein
MRVDFIQFDRSAVGWLQNCNGILARVIATQLNGIPYHTCTCTEREIAYSRESSGARTRI